MSNSQCGSLRALLRSVCTNIQHCNAKVGGLGRALCIHVCLCVWDSEARRVLRIKHCKQRLFLAITRSILLAISVIRNSIARTLDQYTCTYACYERCRRKEERSKQGHTNNKAKQHNNLKAVTFPKKNVHVHVHLGCAVLLCLVCLFV